MDFPVTIAKRLTPTFALEKTAPEKDYVYPRTANACAIKDFWAITVNKRTNALMKPVQEMDNATKILVSN